LKALDLSHSKNLRKIPDFEDIPKLEQLKLEGCEKLVQMDPSMGVLRKLVVLNLKHCRNLASIPNIIFGTSSLKELNLSGCRKVFKNPRKLKKLDSNESSYSQSKTSSILKRTTFCYHSLYPNTHKDLDSCLLPSLLSLSCLYELDISFCGLNQLPDAIGCLHLLEKLKLGGNNFVTLPSLRELSKLVYLNLEHCKLLECLPRLSFPSVFEDRKEYRETGLLIFNCPKLGERESCSSLIFSWMIHIIQACPQFYTGSSGRTIDIVIPGSELSIWFNNQSGSDSIRFDPSPIMHDNDNNIIGICCCAVFTIEPVDPTMTKYAKRPPKIRLGISNYRSTQTNRGDWSDNILVILDRDLIAVKSDHMWLMYFPRERFLNITRLVDGTLNHVHDFNLTVFTENGEGLNLELQNCGYQWVYKQDHASLQKLLSLELQVNEAQPQSFD